ncbi:MAG: GIY-YIG nuclease family protein [Eubacteriales bacterium]|nr:GIY-YIG nuclease family protein [Pseudomonadota bacterium]MBU4532597.1 GIY-YIG nuclease family protein [Bacillota bacterium]MBV1728542.1 GIY-YIG nuclease family protein [Desulforudis sp.]MDP3049899.1 GIY-YIG nuclease family protein [Eubacteriales bacterium]MBU4554943.1 GIY-YIG nuclease family protein [Bacillota bacterium]
MAVNSHYFVYILECSDGSLYTGYTVDLEQRLKAHGDGKASKYTRSRLPVRLVYSEAFDNRSSAVGREAEIKRRPRRDKLQLVNSNQGDGAGSPVNT